MQRYAFTAVDGAGRYVFRHYGISAAQAGKSCRLGIAVELYRHLACALYLVYGVGDVGVLYVCFVGCVVEYQRVVLEGVVHPFAQFFLGYHRAGGVVGIAQVYYVDAAVWYLRNKVVFGRARMYITLLHLPSFTVPARPIITFESMYTG